MKKRKIKPIYFILEQIKPLILFFEVGKDSRTVGRFRNDQAFL
jgi:hypothetical protein